MYVKEAELLVKKIPKGNLRTVHTRLTKLMEEMEWNDEED